MYRYPAQVSATGQVFAATPTVSIDVNWLRPLCMADYLAAQRRSRCGAGLEEAERYVYPLTEPCRIVRTPELPGAFKNDLSPKSRSDGDVR